MKVRAAMRTGGTPTTAMRITYLLLRILNSAILHFCMLYFSDAEPGSLRGLCRTDAKHDGVAQDLG